MTARVVACLWLLVACREQHTEPPTGAPVKPPRSATWLAPEAGVEPPPVGVTQRLFADDVATDELPLSIAIETLGNVSSIVIPRGTKLPTSRTEVFSTAADDQASVEVHVLQGERPLATDNRSLGKFQLVGIPPAPRGVPQIEVTFAVDKAGVLTVRARDRATNRSQKIAIHGAYGATLDKAAVDKMLADAAATRLDDDRRHAWSEARLALEQLIYSSKQVIAGDAKQKLSAKTRKRVEQELRAAVNVLELSKQPADPKLLLAVTESLRKVMYDAAEELYKSP